jgi:hypothetical protein
MNGLSPIISNWFKHKILEVYGSPETKKIPLPSVAVWEEQSVPYFETETHTERIDEGIQPWVNYVSVGIGSFALFFMSSVSLPLGSIILALSVIFFFFGRKKFRKITEVTKEKKVQKTRVEKTVKEVPQFREEIIPGGWAIKRMGTGVLKFGVAKVNETQYLCGIDFSQPLQNFNYPEINNEKKFISDFNDLEKQLVNIPFILDEEKETFDTIGSGKQNNPVSLCGLEKDIMNHFIDTEYAFALYKNKEVHASLVNKNILKDYLLKTAEPFQLYEDDLLSALREGEELDHVCRQWIDLWPEWNKTLQDSRDESVRGQLIPEFIQFSNQTHYSGFNFYCPDCNTEISEKLLQRDYSVHNNRDLSIPRFSKNTRCHYVLDINAWQCPMCEKITLAPIPVHKAFDEIFLPVYDNLMEENKVEREKDYFEVRKKEIHYKNEKRKELEKMYFDNVTGILELKDYMEKMKDEMDGESEAIHFINESLIRYKNLQSDIITDIEQANEELKFQIHEVRQKVLADVNRIKDREVELLNHELTELSKARRLDEELRDSVQREIISANLEKNQLLNSRFNELISFTREGYEKILKSSKNVEDAIKISNAMLVARNEKIGINPYDDSFILRPVRSLKRETAGMTNPLAVK